MTRGERRALARGSILLVFVGGLRILVAPPAGPATTPSADADALPELLEETRDAVEEQERRGATLGEEERLDPNRATEVELDRLPGVGPTTALAIIRTREERGGYRSARDLLQVRGIGPRTLERIESHLDFGAGVPARLRRHRPRAAAAAADTRIALNSATAEELQRLSGIGPALSARILEYRAEKGGFRSVDELMDVPGIGPATLEKIRHRLRPAP